jgi:Uma2 family endonuclease
MVNDINLLDLAGTYSYADYLKWTFEERIELFKGKIFKMSPAPNRIHQRVSGEMFVAFHKIFEKNKCQLFHAPFDVRLPDSKKSTADKSIFTVVQPDLCIICDESKLDDRGCIGAPDLVVEILSPGNTTREMKNKFRLYEEAGVNEYWLVEPNDRIVLVYVLKEGRYIGLAPFTEEDIVESDFFKELKVPVIDIFK